MDAPLDSPRRDPTAHAALARVDRERHVLPLMASMAEHVAARFSPAMLNTPLGRMVIAQASRVTARRDD